MSLPQRREQEVKRRPRPNPAPAVDVVLNPAVVRAAQRARLGRAGENPSEAREPEVSRVVQDQALNRQSPVPASLANRSGRSEADRFKASKKDRRGKSGWGINRPWSPRRLPRAPNPSKSGK